MEIQRRMQTLIYVRHAVHDYTTKLLGKTITLFEWLLLQLYSKKFIGVDIFKEATNECKRFADLRNTAASAISSVNSQFSVTFVDEAQKLSKELTFHCLSDDAMESRSAFSVFLKGFLESRKIKRMGFPVFSGTGLSIDELKVHSTSATTAKKSIKPQIDPFFVNFEPLAARDVGSYLRSFVILDDVGDPVLNHIAKWLRGRPRWTGVYSVRNSKAIKKTRGSLNAEEAKMVQALDRSYLLVMTTHNGEVTRRRHSWSAGEASAYYAIATVMDRMPLEV
jgi:hypothetical protein